MAPQRSTKKVFDLLNCQLQSVTVTVLATSMFLSKIFLLISRVQF